MRLRYLPAVILLLSCMACRQGGVQARDQSASNCIAPAFLVPGDTIALLSPSYNMPMEKVDSAAAVIRSWGFVPVLGSNVEKLYRGKYAGTPGERAADLRRALEDPSVKAIICNRGGYGTIHLIEEMTAEDFSASPKWIVGYSDITTISGMATQAGVMSIHGAMGCSIISHDGKDRTSTLMRDLLLGSIPEYSLDPHPQNIAGEAAGVLVGGNLSTFSPILGSWADATAGKDFILFIEEVEEDMSHIDRMMNTLILHGVFKRCKGVILGEFTDCEANLEYDSVEEMLCSYLAGYGIPVCCGFPAGHDEENLPLLMGAHVNLSVTDSLSRISFELR